MAEIQTTFDVLKRLLTDYKFLCKTTADYLEQQGWMPRHALHKKMIKIYGIAPKVKDCSAIVHDYTKRHNLSYKGNPIAIKGKPLAITTEFVGNDGYTKTALKNLTTSLAELEEANLNLGKMIGQLAARITAIEEKLTKPAEPSSPTIEEVALRG